MAQQAFHAPHGASDFLGLRRGRGGETQIVYDDGVARRMVWRVQGAALGEPRLEDALRAAAGQARVLPALYAELKRRAIGIERIVG